MLLRFYGGNSNDFGQYSHTHTRMFIISNIIYRIRGGSGGGGDGNVAEQ